MIWTYLWQWHAGKLARELRSPWSQEWRTLFQTQNRIWQRLLIVEPQDLDASFQDNSPCAKIVSLLRAYHTLDSGHLALLCTMLCSSFCQGQLRVLLSSWPLPIQTMSWQTGTSRLTGGEACLQAHQTLAPVCTLVLRASGAPPLVLLAFSLLLVAKVCLSVYVTHNTLTVVLVPASVCPTLAWPRPVGRL